MDRNTEDLIDKKFAGRKGGLSSADLFSREEVRSFAAVVHGIARACYMM